MSSALHTLHCASVKMCPFSRISRSTANTRRAQPEPLRLCPAAPPGPPAGPLPRPGPLTCLPAHRQRRGVPVATRPVRHLGRPRRSRESRGRLATAGGAGRLPEGAPRAARAGGARRRQPCWLRAAGRRARLVPGCAAAPFVAVIAARGEAWRETDVGCFFYSRLEDRNSVMRHRCIFPRVNSTGT